jgi:hypothetical protein
MGKLPGESPDWRRRLLSEQSKLSVGLATTQGGVIDVTAKICTFSGSIADERRYGRYTARPKQARSTESTASKKTKHESS